jgi:hypothetical protein
MCRTAGKTGTIESTLGVIIAREIATSPAQPLLDPDWLAQRLARPDGRHRRESTGVDGFQHILPLAFQTLTSGDVSSAQRRSSDAAGITLLSSVIRFRANSAKASGERGLAK